MIEEDKQLLVMLSKWLIDFKNKQNKQKKNEAKK